MIGRGVWISVCAFLAFCFVCVLCDKCLDGCDDDRIYLLAWYDRDKNETSIVLRTSAMTALAMFETDRAILQYPWINVSDTEVEQKVARSQRKSLMSLVDAFPNNNSFRLVYGLDRETMDVLVKIDSGYVRFADSRSRVSVGGGIDVAKVMPYAGEETMTMFAQSRDAVLDKWQNVCKEACTRNASEDTHVTFVYHSNSSTFECSFAYEVPLVHWVRADCVGSGGSGYKWDVRARHPRLALFVWKDPKCEVSTAKCVIECDAGWKKEVAVVVVDDGIVGALDWTYVSASGVVFSIVVMTLFVLIYGVCGRRSSAGSGF